MGGACTRREQCPPPTPERLTTDRFIAGHSYYALATIAHQAGVPITSEAITDQREQRLLMPPATLIEDLFGPVDYRRGQGRPLVNLREAINALLRGELPGSPEAPIQPRSRLDLLRTRDVFRCRKWIDHDLAFGPNWGAQIFAARLELAMPRGRISRRSGRSLTERPLPPCHAAGHRRSAGGIRNEGDSAKHCDETGNACHAEPRLPGDNGYRHCGKRTLPLRRRRRRAGPHFLA